MPTESLTIDAGRAAILYSALSTAIITTRLQLDLKSAQHYRGAIEMQLSAYEGEKAALARSFPTLGDGK